jgi:hypothetical protein
MNANTSNADHAESCQSQTPNIFLSYNHNDEKSVSLIAQRFADVFGKDHVFFDKWSMRPGDSIIGKMNDGLTNCTHFIFFISKNSVSSEMVSLEWKAALLKKSKQQLTFIPIRLDQSEVPTILKDTVYLDATKVDVEQLVRQIVDVIKGKDQEENLEEFHNLQATVVFDGQDKMSVEIRATTFMEPQTEFYFFFLGHKDNFNFKVTSDAMFISSVKDGPEPDSLGQTTIIVLSVSRALSLGFPFRARFSTKDGSPLKSLIIAHPISENVLKQVPVEEKR